MPTPQLRATKITEARGAERSLFVTAKDGLRLHVREYGARTAPALPVVCLPGLTRTVADFAELAPTLACGDPQRRAIAIDSRGRGRSDYDPNPQNYNVAVELGDVVTVLGALGIGEAIFVGSSRGGILTMLLAATHPAAVAGAVLHDIGPAIETAGVARIKSYVGKLPRPQSFADGAEILRSLFGAQFPRLSTEQWRAAAERAWKIEGEALVPTYDIALSHTLDGFDAEHPLPTMWKEFDALAHVPVMVIRGANSDLLSAETVNTMRERHPGLESIVIADEGHVPLLGSTLIGRIGEFVRSCDTALSSP